MGVSSRGLNEKRARIGRLARRRAFESYLRRGRVPEKYARLAEAARDEKAFRDFYRSDLSLKALGDLRPTTYYTWRTMRDERVRKTHRDNADKVFSWRNPPPGSGHPGTEPNCRCSAEPYYGDPFVPDELLPLKYERRTDSTGKQPWISIETVTRPDGSPVQRTIVGRDGTRYHSTFVGSHVTHEVRLPRGPRIRIERQNGVQTVYVGDSGVPVARSTWARERYLGTLNLAELGRGGDDAEKYEMADLLRSVRLYDKVFAGAAAGALALALIALYKAYRAQQDRRNDAANAAPSDAAR